MKITIDWQTPIQLTQNQKLLFDENEIPEEIKSSPAVYYFSRSHGDRLIPFYIGETLSVRARLKSHLQTVKIVDVLFGRLGDHQIKNGRRFFHYGYLTGNPSRETAKKRLIIVQRLMIQIAVEGEIAMLNKSLTKIPTHNIVFAGSAVGRGEYEKNHAIVSR